MSDFHDRYKDAIRPVYQIRNHRHSTCFTKILKMLGTGMLLILAVFLQRHICYSLTERTVLNRVKFQK